MATATNPEKIGRYQILERVGRGGMGVLYRGFDPVLDREVAIKVMLTDFSEDAEQMRPRFYREAKAVAKLQHRNIVTIFEFAEEENKPHIVMEFLRGLSLAQRLAQQPKLTLDDKLDIVAQLCSALGYAHGQGVVHRDVKPANVFLLTDGSVKLLDFGIAKLTTSTLTRQGDVLGSASYMSPEQVAGSESVDGRADVFSTGVLLYEMLAGRKPFEGEAPTVVIVKILKEEPTPIESIVPGLPAQLVAAVKKSLQKDPANRFAKADDFGRELQWIRKALQASGDLAPLDETRFASTQVLRALHEDIQTGRAGAAKTSVSSATGAPLDAELASTPPKNKWLVPAGIGGVVLAAVIGGAIMYTRGTPAQAGSQATPLATTQAAATAPAAPPPATAAPPVAADATNAKMPAVVNASAEPSPATAKPAAEIRKPVPAAAQVAVSLTGAYPFEVYDGSRRISDADVSHDLNVSSGRTLRLVAGDYFLDRPIRVEGGPGKPFDSSAPGLGRLTVRTSFETCTVKIGSHDLGFPPIANKPIAAGNYQIDLICPNGQNQKGFATVNPGQTAEVRLR
jgi:serine/threonine protein kinase